jgi:hypothetical protein
MVQMRQPARWGGSAALWGCGFGLLIALVGAVARLIVQPAERPVALLAELTGGPLWLRAVLLVVALVGFFLAGVFAARSAHLVEPGIVAGLLAGVIVGLALVLRALVDGQTAVERPRLSALGRFTHALTALGIARMLLVLVLTVLVGVGMGALGALLGRRRQRPMYASPYGMPPGGGYATMPSAPPFPPTSPASDPHAPLYGTPAAYPPAYPPTPP